MPAKQDVTICDVAKQAGLSVATVSRALNRSPKLKPQTVQKVFDAVERLGYDAAPITGRATVRARSQTKNFTVEVIFAPPADGMEISKFDFFSSVYAGIQSFFLQSGNVIPSLVMWDPRWKKPADFPGPLTERLKRADALMVGGDLDPEITLALRGFNRNIISMFCNEVNSLPVDSVVNNNFMAGMDAAGLLVDNGAADIGFLASPERISSHELRLDGAMVRTIRLLGQKHFSFRRAASIEAADIDAAIGEWLDAPDFPRAFVVPQAWAAGRLRELAAARGLRCPEDIGIVCFDNPGDQPDGFRFTYLDTLPRELGIKAAQRIVQRLITPYSDDTPHCIMLPCKPVMGDSVKMRTTTPAGRAGADRK